jgi:hypothetical protein
MKSRDRRVVEARRTRVRTASFAQWKEPLDKIVRIFERRVVKAQHVVERSSSVVAAGAFVEGDDAPAAFIVSDF